MKNTNLIMTRFFQVSLLKPMKKKLLTDSFRFFRFYWSSSFSFSFSAAVAAVAADVVEEDVITVTLMAVRLWVDGVLEDFLPEALAVEIPAAVSVEEVSAAVAASVEEAVPAAEVPVEAFDNLIDSQSMKRKNTKGRRYMLFVFFYHASFSFSIRVVVMIDAVSSIDLLATLMTRQ